MTQYKLIAREPTDEMLRAIDEMEDYTHVAGFQAMFDAAPHIETEAEKRIKERMEILKREIDNYIHEKALEMFEIIRALLVERGIK